ncbi:hypothetical protein GGI02_003663, partial [Coemansia sp. RSA 2322]
MTSATASRAVAAASAPLLRGYHRPTRSEAFKSLGREDYAFFQTVLPAETMLATAEIGGVADMAELEGFNADWLSKYRGNSQL